MPPVRRLVIDVLKPHEPSILEFTEQLSAVDSVESVTGTLLELDQEVQNVKLTFEGSAVDFDAIRHAIDGIGASVHSIDEVSCGEYIVENRVTPQDH